MKKEKHSKQTKTIRKPEIMKAPFSWKKFSTKILILFLAVVSVVIFTDKKDYFAADQNNNHIKKHWTSFYNFTHEKEVDVIILGNSHAITGVDPFVLSNATSSSCFLLGNSGTNIIDAWFQLGGVLKYTQPKLVVLETFCINNDENLKHNAIPYLQSFDAQKDILYKLQCMPQLFYSDSWVEAWSTSIRNHSFLLTDTVRIKYNSRNMGEPKSNKLDLGRFARFNTGLQDSILAKYESKGSPVKGREYQISNISKNYLRQIMIMCEERNIPVLFLTVPMYYKHISDYDAWKSTINDELQKYPKAKWLDLQMPYDTMIYTPDMFENTYSANQHLTNLGMMVTAYKLAGFIEDNYPKLLPDRSKDAKWIADFMTNEHFVFNQDVADGMADFSSITKNKRIGNFQIRELALQNNEESNRLILKIVKQNNLPNRLTVQLKILFQGNNFSVPIQMSGVKNIFPPNYKVYLVDLRKEVKVADVLSISN